MRFSLNIALQPEPRVWWTRWSGWPALFAVLLLGATLVFFALPWSVEGKSLAVLHGICAQQPSHTFYFGDGRLPFDARMTGIYGGFTVTSLVLLALGRWRASGLPPVSVLALVGLAILPLAIDGLNSTVRDMRGWSLYTPHNELRLATGLLAGFTLASFVWMLLGQVAFARQAGSQIPLLRGYRELGLILLAQGAFAALVLTSWSPLRVPLSLALMLAAIAALTGLMLGFVLLILRRENQALDAWQLAGPATMALLLAFGLLGGLSGMRFAMELVAGVPTTV